MFVHGHFMNIICKTLKSKIWLQPQSKLTKDLYILFVKMLQKLFNNMKAMH